jgi:hypothetical protein
LDAVDHLTENQGPIAPTRPRSAYFDVVVEARKPGFDADSFRQGLQEALVQDPDLLALGRRQGGFNDHARFVGVGVNRLWRLLPRRLTGCASTLSPTAGSTATSSTPSSPTTSERS